MNVQSRFFIQYQCAESSQLLEQKEMSSIIIALIEVITAFLALGFIVVNQQNTRRLGKAYDELNLTASDYNVKVDVRARHRQEFELMYANELSLPNGTPRGILFKKYLEQKLRVQGVNLARIDLVFDCKKMIDLLQQRGNAIKVQNHQKLQEIEEKIEDQK